MFTAPTANLPQRFALKHKTIVITGGARGLGLSFASALAEVGANIAAIDLDDSPPDELGKLQAIGVKAKYYTANVQDYDGLRNTIEKIAEDFGSIDGW
ncbi:putative secondary metabolism biosynthetic enzyme [Cryomyces antarcticus]|uniref:Secondary metabolism biosynthetic enzyme n=1 Tax=Cryomyces antarcticus TaxID=329879 RepID=A0ABR0LQT8_9PEZI|nr:putative secondary metabolism biosynthetic enzyme [Cryomyces antarcticus]